VISKIKIGVGGNKQQQETPNNKIAMLNDTVTIACVVIYGTFVSDSR